MRPRVNGMFGIANLPSIQGLRAVGRVRPRLRRREAAA